MPISSQDIAVIWAAFGVGLGPRCEVRCGVGLRRRLYGSFLHFGDDRSDEPIAAAGHGLDPPIAAWCFTQDPTQRRDLHREVAFFDSLTGPRRLDQRILRHHRARLLDQRAQQGYRSSPER
jgi:hypothetical protein